MEVYDLEQNVLSVNDSTPDENGNVALELIKALSIAGTTITVTKQDGTTYELDTQDTKYTLPIASTSVLGGVKVGSNLTMTNGVLSGTPDTKYTHPNSGVTAGTYDKVTVNAQGHVTAGSNPVNAYVTETYRSGNLWYRKWSDGFIEQGAGNFWLADTWTITFPKPFTTTNYVLTGEERGSDANGNLGIITQNTSTANGNIVGTGGRTVNWYACGY